MILVPLRVVKRKFSLIECWMNISLKALRYVECVNPMDYVWEVPTKGY